MVQLDPAVANNWGNEANPWPLIAEQGSVGVVTVSLAGLTTYSLTTANNAPDQARYANYAFTGALTGDCTVTLPAISRTGCALNATTGNHSVILTDGSGQKLTLRNGYNYFWRSDGTNVVADQQGFTNIGAEGIRPGLTQMGGSWAFSADASFAYQLFTTGWGWYWNRSNGNLSYRNGSGAVEFQMQTNFSAFGPNILPGAQVQGIGFDNVNHTITISSVNLGMNIGTASGNQIFFFNYTSGANVGSITSNLSNTFFNSTSDANLKIDRGAIVGETATAYISQLIPRWFNWKVRPDDERQPGFFAQEVHKVHPWGVQPGRAQPKHDDFKPWQMDPAKLIPMLVAAVQHLQARVAELERR